MVKVRFFRKSLKMQKRNLRIFFFFVEDYNEYMRGKNTKEERTKEKEEEQQ